MNTTRGDQGKLPKIVVTANLTFGAKSLYIALGDEQIRTPSDIIADFAYGLLLLLTMGGIPTAALALFTGHAGLKLEMLARDLINNPMSKDVKLLYELAKKQGILDRKYMEGVGQKSDTEQ